MEALDLSAEQLAAAVGARPFLLLALLLTGTVGPILGLVAVARLSERHARALWGRAIRAYGKVGFRPVGAMRRYERGPDGTFHDGLLMDLLADELS